ncbi:hypothetical protein L1987_59035 [Smallanthus sonchifolius]|uniref:Uncharacterized protein n=1 Tax=Smallanthus sonchifolius TaxID=185202 RepID=A0ACB9D4M9_9ASTR|nr:hypothetical protein L1987_59035 [Smallanthus sonchifolius]
MLGFNNFKGKLSDSLLEMINLERFAVSSNEISGHIPAGICGGATGSSSSLKVLNTCTMFYGCNQLQKAHTSSLPSPPLFLRRFRERKSRERKCSSEITLTQCSLQDKLCSDFDQ